MFDTSHLGVAQMILQLFSGRELNARLKPFSFAMFYRESSTLHGAVKSSQMGPILSHSHLAKLQGKVHLRGDLNHD